MTDHLYLALISHLPNFTKCSKETFVFCQFFSFIRISFGACHFLSLFFAVVFLSLLAENHRCFVCVWMCLQLHFKTNSLQPEFNSKKIIAHDFAKYFDFMLSLLCFACSRLLIVCFCLGFCFDGICCFIRIGRASHKNHFRYDFKCSSFSVLVFVYNQSPSYLWIFIYLFVCCCYGFFFIKTKW